IIDGDIGDAEQRQDEGITSLNRILYSLRTDGLRTDHRTHLCGRESVRIASRPPRTYPRCVLYGHRRDPSRYVRITSESAGKCGKGVASRSVTNSGWLSAV